MLKAVIMVWVIGCKFFQNPKNLKENFSNEPIFANFIYCPVF